MSVLVILARNSAAHTLDLVADVATWLADRVAP